MSADGRAQRFEARLGSEGTPPDVAPAEEPPAEQGRREEEWLAGQSGAERDTRPATGTPGGPASWRRAEEGAHVALARPGWGDAVWSFLYKDDTDYARARPAPGQVAEAARRVRSEEVPPEQLHGPFIKPPVWTWEVPLYFWVGGVAAGSSFVALACDVAGDHRSAELARRVALGTVATAPPLLIADLGRPGRFLNMLRIFKPRSPMNLGAWCLVGFSVTAAGGVAADLLRAPRIARALGGATAVLGGYLGSYTGVLLASTAVPLWSRSRLALGPIFVATATATGAATCRLALVAAEGLRPDHPTRRALQRLESGAILTELAISSLNERRMGRVAEGLRRGRSGTVFSAAKWLVRGGLALQLASRRGVPHAEDAASVCYLAGGLAFRYAWVEAGKHSALDDEAVARTARGRATAEDELRRRRPVRRQESTARARVAGGAPARAMRVWTETVRRVSLGAEKLLRPVLPRGG